MGSGAAAEQRRPLRHPCLPQNDTLRFYHIGAFLAPLAEQPPAALRLSRYEVQIDLPVQLVTQDSRWASIP